MDTATSFRSYRFTGEIMAHGTWVYFRFCLRFRDIQEIMRERGITVSCEAIRLWTLAFGDDYDASVATDSVSTTRGALTKCF